MLSNKDAAKVMLRMMERQTFADWYADEFTKYVEGDCDHDAEAKQGMLDYLESVFAIGAQSIKRAKKAATKS